MLTIRRSHERGQADHGWLRSRHTFSFGGYHDRKQMGFRALRVINEDWIAPGHGFDTHPHRDMEIVTYVLEGALRHCDSLGTTEILRPGELQRMSAGTGIEHSEFNASATEPVHLYQIWIRPRVAGATPSYEQRAFPSADRRNRLQLVASPDGEEGALQIGQDARIHLADLDPGLPLTLPKCHLDHRWLQVLRGSVDLRGERLDAGDAAAISEPSAIELRAAVPSEVMLFELA